MENQTNQQKVSLTRPVTDPIWKAKGKDGNVKVIKMRDMDNNHLQKAFLLSQRRMIAIHNDMLIHENLASQLEAEAKRRGMKLIDVNDLKQVSGIISKRKYVNDIKE